MKYCLVLCLLLVMLACKDKKINFSGEVPVKIGDFIAAFPKLIPNYWVADTNINKASDTITIGYKVLQQFFPDSAITKIVSNSKKLSIHPVGIIEKEKENYLLINFISQKKITYLVVFVVDKKNKYLASKQLLSSFNDDGYSHFISINREPTFLISKEKRNKDEVNKFSRTGWVYTSAGNFMVVINDTNEDPQKKAVINPIDTLPKKNKYSGEYVQDKKNYISIRDTKKNNVYLFFIHFEKNVGACIGELKGELKMKNTNAAQFKENGDPCIIDFRFEENEIILIEQGSCGNHRGIKCIFNDTFVKKKETRKLTKR